MAAATFASKGEYAPPSKLVPPSEKAGDAGDATSGELFASGIGDMAAGEGGAARGRRLVSS